MLCYVGRMEDYTRDLCVCGFHMYHNIWDAAVAMVCASWFAQEIAAAGTLDDSEPFGSGIQSLRFKYCSRATEATLTVSPYCLYT